MTERLAVILARGDSGIAHTVRNCLRVSLWNEIVDERLRKHTEAIKIRNKVLYVSASSPTWAQELSFLKREIIKKFNERAGEEAICDIRFRGEG